MNNDALSYWNKSPEKCVQTAQKEKKWKYLEACLQKRRHFSPFIFSVDVLLIDEAEAALKRISSRLATKCKQPYYKTCGYVNIRVAITLVRATH